MSSFKILWTKTAQADLKEIIEYISLDSIETGRKQYHRIKESLEGLQEFPKAGRVVPELMEQNIREYKEVIVSPWRIMYKILGENVYVMAIIDSRRNIEDVLLKRQLR